MLKASLSDLSSVVTQILVQAGARSNEARHVATALLWADARGLATQGTWRLPILVDRLRAGGIKSPAAAEIRNVADACRVIDGGGGSGHYNAVVATTVAARLARRFGVSCIGVNNSNYCGALGYYVWRAAERGCASLFLSNSFPKVAAPGARHPTIGTNPIAIGAPGPEPSQHFVLDMATSVAAGSKIRRLAESGANVSHELAKQAPEGSANNGGAFLLNPFGGWKGYGLGLAVEMLAGVVAGAAFMNDVQSMYAHVSRPGGNGHLMIAVYVPAFMTKSDYARRYSLFRKRLGRSSDCENARLPGELRNQKYLQALRSNTLELDDESHERIRAVASKVGVSWPASLNMQGGAPR